jgi:pimeloyl-ACP methyl ester carboxylesterase
MIGRGDSDWVAQPMLYSVPQYVSDCVTLVARLGVESVDWVGTSMGGLIGMTYAALSGHPIRRMVLNDIGPKLEWAGLSTIAAYVGQVPVFTEYSEAASWLRGRMVGFGPHDEDGWDQLTRPYFKVSPDGGFTPHYDPAIAVPFKALAQGAESVGEPSGKPAGESEEHSMWPLWDAVTPSTLVLRGALSELLSTETCEGMKTRGPKARVIEIAGVGHAPTLIALDQINPILEFFSEPSSS